MEHGSARIGELFDFGMLHLEWPTALFVFVVFLLTMIVLNSLLFKPILRTLEARQAEIDKSKEEAAKAKMKNEQAQNDYESKLADMRETIHRSRQEALDEAMKNASQLIDQAKKSMASKIEDAEKEIQTEQKKALDEAASITGDLAKMIKARVLS